MKNFKELCKRSMLFAIIFICFFPKAVFAYIDPSAMTFAVQAVLGIVVTAGAVVGIAWRSARKKIGKTLGIDENKNKEVESDEIE